MKTKSVTFSLFLLWTIIFQLIMGSAFAQSETTHAADQKLNVSFSAIPILMLDLRRMAWAR